MQNEDVNNKVCENHAYELVQFKVGQTYGEPIQYVSRKDDEKVNKAVDTLNDYMSDANKQEKILRQESGSQQPAHLLRQYRLLTATYRFGL